MLIKVRCPFCGAYDQITVGLDFSVGSRCWRNCSNCGKPVLILCTKNGYDTARLNREILNDSAVDTERYLLEQEIKLRKQLGYLGSEEFVSAEADKSPDEDWQHDEFRCACCKQAITVPLRKGMVNLLTKKTPVVILTFCEICHSAVGVIFTGNLFSVAITECFPIDWDELFWEEGKDQAQEIIEEKVREDFNIPESFEVRFFNDELPDPEEETDEDDPDDLGDLSAKISDAEVQEFAEVDLGEKINNSQWWAQGGPFQR